MKRRLSTLIFLGVFSLTACNHDKTKLEQQIQALNAQLLEQQKINDERINKIREISEIEIVAVKKQSEEKIAEAQHIFNTKLAELTNALDEARKEAIIAKQAVNEKQDKFAEAIDGLKESFSLSMNEARSVIADKMNHFGKAIQNVASELQTDDKDLYKAIEKAAEEMKKELSQERSMKYQKSSQ